MEWLDACSPSWDAQNSVSQPSLTRFKVRESRLDPTSCTDYQDQSRVSNIANIHKSAQNIVLTDESWDWALTKDADVVRSNQASLRQGHTTFAAPILVKNALDEKVSPTDDEANKSPYCSMILSRHYRFVRLQQGYDVQTYNMQRDVEHPFLVPNVSQSYISLFSNTYSHDSSTSAPGRLRARPRSILIQVTASRIHIWLEPPATSRGQMRATWLG